MWINQFKQHSQLNSHANAAIHTVLTLCLRALKQKLIKKSEGKFSCRCFLRIYTIQYYTFVYYEFSYIILRKDYWFYLQGFYFDSYFHINNTIYSVIRIFLNGIMALIRCCCCCFGCCCLAYFVYWYLFKSFKK